MKSHRHKAPFEKELLSALKSSTGRRTGWTEKITAIASLAAILLSLVGVYIGIQSVQEVKSQREFTYRPKIVLSASSVVHAYYIFNYEVEDVCLACTEWSASPVAPHVMDGLEKANAQLRVDGMIRIVNVGTGSADSVRATWS